MTEVLEFGLRTVFIGIGATIILDLWMALLSKLFGLPATNWGLVGRWFGHCAMGRFTHNSIANAAPIRGELIIGWSAHYATGIVFAGILLSFWGLDWARQPTLTPALIVGVLTVAAPFFVMQPGMGAGIAASKTPKPNVARLRSLMAHAVLGIGFYGAAVIGTHMIPS